MCTQNVATTLGQYVSELNMSSKQPRICVTDILQLMIHAGMFGLFVFFFPKVYSYRDPATIAVKKYKSLSTLGTTHDSNYSLSPVPTGEKCYTLFLLAFPGA